MLMHLSLQGLSEIIELGIKMGAKRHTFYGLSGIGDLTLTCTSLKSRNTKLGYLLAKNKKDLKVKLLKEWIHVKVFVVWEKNMMLNYRFATP